MSSATDSLIAVKPLADALGYDTERMLTLARLLDDYASKYNIVRRDRKIDLESILERISIRSTLLAHKYARIREQHRRALNLRESEWKAKHKRRAKRVIKDHNIIAAACVLYEEGDKNA